MNFLFEGSDHDLSHNLEETEMLVSNTGVVFNVEVFDEGDDSGSHASFVFQKFTTSFNKFGVDNIFDVFD